ncbi:hypothetical protein [Xanthobacter oligotrophicus]|uniref:hypothetical protein n=1 Tax=Xanthobacter oligotrophicus TaxID=2607286 RepID=UPI0011F157C0|nr:hypothetical protein [Xanthobacter oligotrophicus]MCG5237398.1 hypothetical protein [Xanthobacter oligotrophicus]
MNFFDFITQDELDELPDDPEAAFVLFASLAQGRLAERQRGLDLNDSSDWELLNEARHGFMNVVVAVGRRFGIEPFCSMEMPKIADFGTKEHQQFKADLDFYIAQIAVGNSMRGKRDSVNIPLSVKDRIRSYVAALKSEVEKAEIGDARRSALLDKLAKFERELEKNRLTLLELTRVIVAVAAVPGALWASTEITFKLVNNVIQAVGEAKATEDSERQLVSTEPMKALSPPRIKTETSVRRSPDALDDEIPF